MLSIILFAIPALAMTRVTFRGADVWPEPSEWAAHAALLEAASGPKYEAEALGQMEWGKLRALANQEGIADWKDLRAMKRPAITEALLKVPGTQTAGTSPQYIKEVDYFNKQEAVKQVWQKTNVIYDYSKQAQTGAVSAMLDKIVPGLTVSFKEIFDAFDAAGCPVWLIGGTVRDLLAGMKPNDVDTAILCDTRVVKRVCTQKGWMHSPEDHVREPYFSVGIAHGENEEYLEGFSIDLVMRDPFTPETTVNMLFWSVKESFVVDPSNYGTKDAPAHVLRPAAPPHELVAHGTTWATWRQWILGSFSGPQHMRHNRYLKMRQRGWTPVRDTETQPAPECFQFFMGNQLATLLPLEGMQPELVIDPRTMMTRTGDQQPMVPGATLIFMQEKPAKMDETKAAAYVSKFLDVLFEELDAYYALPPSTYMTCTQGGRVAKRDDRGAAQSSQALLSSTLIQMCERPPMHLLVAAHAEMFAPPGAEVPPSNFPRACRDLLAAWKAKTGESRTASEFKLPGAASTALNGGRMSQAIMTSIPTLMPYLEPYWFSRTHVQPAVPRQFLPQVVTLAPMPPGPIQQPLFMPFPAPAHMPPLNPMPPMGRTSMVRTSGGVALDAFGNPVPAVMGHAGMDPRLSHPMGPGGLAMDPASMPGRHAWRHSLGAPPSNMPTLGHIPAHGHMPAHGGFPGAGLPLPPSDRPSVVRHSVGHRGSMGFF